MHRRDAEAARRICAALRAAGIEVWFHQSELRGGESWDQQIRHQTKDCALFVPLVSSNTQTRPEGYFRLESMRRIGVVAAGVLITGVIALQAWRLITPQGGASSVALPASQHALSAATPRSCPRSCPISEGCLSEPLPQIAQAIHNGHSLLADAAARALCEAQ